MKLEKMFRRVHANSANLFHGRSPLFEICNDLILAQSMPSGAVHTNTAIKVGPARLIIQDRPWTILIGSFVLQAGAYFVAPLRRALGLAPIGFGAGVITAFSSVLPSLVTLWRCTGPQAQLEEKRIGAL